MRSIRRKKRKVNQLRNSVIFILVIVFAIGGYFGLEQNIFNPEYSETVVAQERLAGTYLVERIIDGDTAIFIDGEDVSHRVRFIGIDAPESTGRNIEPGGHEATAFLKELIPVGSQVWLERCSNRPVDRFDRVRAYIWLTEPTIDTNARSYLVNALMIKNGHAEVMIMSGDTSVHEGLFEKLEAYARNNGLGMWSSS